MGKAGFEPAMMWISRFTVCRLKPLSHFPFVPIFEKKLFKLNLSSFQMLTTLAKTNRLVPFLKSRLTFLPILLKANNGDWTRISRVTVWYFDQLSYIHHERLETELNRHSKICNLIHYHYVIQPKTLFLLWIALAF